MDFVLESLRQLQQHLGEINDSAASAAFLLERRDLNDRQRAAIRRSLGRSAALAAQAFRAFWDEHFRPAARQKEVLQYLGAAGSVKSGRTSRPPREST